MVSDSLVKKFCDAIESAEGFFHKNANGVPNLPQRCNNPGDLTDDGDVGLGTARSKGLGATDITIYPTYAAGRAALEKKIRRALNGASSVYTLDLSIENFGMKYARDPQWGVNVASSLGVSPLATLADLVQADLNLQRQNLNA
jgi:hypothetical protein